MDRPEAVVFDIGNVLIEWNPERFYDALIGPEARRALFAEVDLAGMNLAVDGGAPFRETVMAMADAHPRWAEAIRHWHDDWIEMARPEIPHSVRLLRALKAKGVPVFALTNFGRDTFAHAATVYPFFHEFDRAFVSAHLGCLKPDPAIYAAVEAGTGFAGARLIFADDGPRNVAAAEARGWRAHLFEGPAGWAARLVEEGLLTEEEAR